MKSIFTTLLIASLIVYFFCYAVTPQSKKDVKPIVTHSIRDTLIQAQRELSAANRIIKEKETPSAMPWIAALIIGALTFGANFFISYNARRTGLEISVRDFNKTILSGSRQIWISEFRILLSEILSQLSYFILKQSINNDEFEVFSLRLTKAELMLSNEDHKTFVEIISKLQASCFEILKANPPNDELEDLILELKTHTVTIIKDQWILVKEGK